MQFLMYKPRHIHILGPLIGDPGDITRCYLPIDDTRMKTICIYYYDDDDLPDDAGSKLNGPTRIKKKETKIPVIMELSLASYPPSEKNYGNDLSDESEVPKTADTVRIDYLPNVDREDSNPLSFFNIDAKEGGVMTML